MTEIEESSITKLSKFGLSPQAEAQLSELDSMYGTARDRIEALVITLRDVDQLPYEEIKKVLLKRVRFCSRSTVYNILPDYMKREYTKMESTGSEEESSNGEPEESDEERLIKQIEDLPTIVVPSTRQQTIDEFLDGYADGERSFYFQDVSMTFVRTQLLTRKGVNKFRRVFFEVE